VVCAQHQEGPRLHQLHRINKDRSSKDDSSSIENREEQVGEIINNGRKVVGNREWWR